MSENLNSPSPAISYGDWHEYAYVYWRARPEQREGQAYFNALYIHRPDIADRLRSGPLDPFYNDDMLPAFFNYVGATW